MVPRKPDLPLRLAAPGEAGSMPFYEHLRDRVRGSGGRAQLAERMSAFLHQWDVLADDKGRAPTAAEYAERWEVSEQTAYRLAAEFRELFPTEDDPTRLLSLLWGGVGRGPTHLFSVPVIQEFEERLH